MTTVYIAIAVIFAGLLAGLPGWLALRRTRRLARRADDYETVVSMIGPPPEPPRTDREPPKPHLRIVALWLPLATIGAWLLGRLAAHSTQVAATALIASAATVTTLVVSQSAAPPTRVSLPPQHTATTTDGRPPGRTVVDGPTASAGDTTAAVVSRTPSSVEASAQPVQPPSATSVLQPPPATASATTTAAAPAPTTSPTCVALAPLSIDLPGCVDSVLGVLDN